MMRTCSWMLCLLLSTPALAQDVETRTFEKRPVVGHPVLDFRLGGETSSPSSYPYMCAEVYPLAWLSVEGCGNGEGILHDSDVPDMAHFRARVRLVELPTGTRTTLAAVAGVGFVEVQRGEDDHGFLFGRARTADQTSGAGPEVSLSGKARYWFDPRAYLTADLNAGIAHVPSAPVVIGKGGAAVGFAAATVGVGF